MRRLLSIAMILLLALPFVAPALGQSTAANVPICCRMHGAHKCMTHMLETSSSPRVQAHCPMQTNQAAPGHSVDWLAGSESFDSGTTLVSASRVWQVEAGFRISHSRSRQKRGPPSVRTS